MKKRLFLVILAMCTAMAVSACSGTADTETKTPAESVENTKEQKSVGETRIVSVKDVEDYVDIAEYKGIEIENAVQKVTDAMVEEQILQNLENASKETCGSKAKIQEGDLVTVSYIATIDGKNFDGGNVNNYDFTVGSGEMLEGFEEAVIGMKTGETRKISCVFPEDAQGSAVAGKEVDFSVTVQTIRRTPKLSDAWAAANSEAETAEGYKELVKAELEASMDADAEESMKSTAWHTVVTNSTMIKYPEEDIETAKFLYNSQMTAYAEQYGMELEEFVKSQGITMEEYEEQSQLYAERKVKQNLIVQGIMDAEKISLEDEESLKIQDQIMAEYGADSEADFIDRYSQIQIDESIALLRIEEFIYQNAVIVDPFLKQPENEPVEPETEPAETEPVEPETEPVETETEPVEPEAEPAETEAESTETGQE